VIRCQIPSFFCEPADARADFADPRRQNSIGDTAPASGAPEACFSLCFGVPLLAPVSLPAAPLVAA
jgi:hypothetical protein